MAGFSVVTMVREDPAIVGHFARYYRSLGAERIFICFDGYTPEPELAAPGRELIVIGDDFWRMAGGKRPEALEARQHAAYAHCLARCQSEWLLVVDCDEYVFGPEPVAALLDTVPDGIDGIRLRTAEAVWGHGDDVTMPWGATHFRLAYENRPLWYALRWLLHGLDAGFFHRGVIGHVGGKQFVRTGRGVEEVRAHVAFREGRMITRWADSLGPRSTGFFVGHFDAVGLPRWRAKWEKRFSGIGRVDHMRPARRRQVRAISRTFARGGGAPEKLFSRFYRLTGWRYKLLEKLGLAFRQPLFDMPLENDTHGH
ncbi:MAG: glycosyltransferase family 2 protein [Notoacmeibacter sp.]|nr:glycosyltransferase family 2 protein [Notoacmeibacter sp.]